MILIVGQESDGHVDQVVRHLSRPHIVVDTGLFPASVGVSVGFTDHSASRRLRLPEGKELDLGEVGAVWYRRLRPLGLHQDLAGDVARLFAWSESNEALLGLWYSLDCFWMNSPTADEIAQRKIRQLQVAQAVGLAIPETLITNQPDEARQFIERHGTGNVIRKAFRNIAEAPRETIVLSEQELAMLDAVRYAPVIFQRYVPAVMDLRVTVIDREMFAAAITSTPKYQADYRLGLRTASVVPHELPPGEVSALQALMQRFDISYGAIDLRLTPQGQYVFLEVNPAGEFLFISERTGQPIPAAIARTLERHDREHEKRRAS